LDFAEEDVEFANRDQLKDLVAQVREVVSQLINSFSLGNAMKNGVTTVIAGRPNAGKSTLLNALLGDERAIVSDIEGTTRDTIEEVLVVNGIAFRLVDTAGIREAQDKIEAIGVERTMQKVGESAVVMYVFDTINMSREEVNEDLAKLEQVAGHNSILVVANKMDWNPYTKPEEWIGEHLSKDQFIPVSAKNSMNIEYLKERLVGMVDDGTIDPSQQIISSVRHLNALRKVDDSLVAVQTGFEDQVTSDFIAMDMRQALHWLGEITGEVSADDILGNIFSKFCIGK
jgi:tRNA modification GTPase